MAGGRYEIATERHEGKEKQRNERLTRSDEGVTQGEGCTARRWSCTKRETYRETKNTEKY